jgi:MFS transporter, DHA1 family, multidrug resistance protein
MCRALKIDSLILAGAWGSGSDHYGPAERLSTPLLTSFARKVTVAQLVRQRTPRRRSDSGAVFPVTRQIAGGVANKTAACALNSNLPLSRNRSPRRMKRPRTLALTLFLSFLSTLGPFSLDMYLPSLPDIGRSLQASTLEVQLTISSYLFGSAVGQIFYGSFSDRLGRRPVLMAALVLYSVVTIGCAAAPSIGALVALRFIQGIGVAGAMALARAMVRDISSGVRAGRALSLMGSITGFAPIIAPVIGGALQTWFGWRANFVLLLLIAGVMGTITVLRLPETLRHPIKTPFSIIAMAALYRSVALHRGYLSYLAILTLGIAGLFAWLSGASVIMQGALYGLSPFVFGANFAIGSAGYVLGTLIAARAMVRFGLDFVIGVGTAGMALGGLSMAAVIGFGLLNVLWFIAAMTLYLTGLGLALAATRAGALTPFRDRAATAASVMGLTQQTGAAVSATVVGFYLGHSAWPVASVVAAMGCLSFVIWGLTRRVRARR